MRILVVAILIAGVQIIVVELGVIHSRTQSTIVLLQVLRDIFVVISPTLIIGTKLINKS